jgi:hypothetical protein
VAAHVSYIQIWRPKRQRLGDGRDPPLDKDQSAQPNASVVLAIRACGRAEWLSWTVTDGRASMRSGLRRPLIGEFRSSLRSSLVMVSRPSCRWTAALCAGCRLNAAADTWSRNRSRVRLPNVGERLSKGLLGRACPALITDGCTPMLCSGRPAELPGLRAEHTRSGRAKRARLARRDGG